MRSFSARLVVCVFAVAIFASAGHANGSDSTYSVGVLGCKLPVPTAYVLDATYHRSIVLLHDDGEGHIQIEEFTGIPDRFKVVSERAEGRLIVAEVTVTTEGRVPDSMVILRDQTHSVSLIGAARELEASFLEACLAGEE
jgi:hypothetical protein